MIPKIKYYLMQRQYTLDELIQFLLSFALVVVPAFFIPNRNLIDPYSQPRLIMLGAIACALLLVFIVQPRRIVSIFKKNRLVNSLVLVYILILTYSLTYSIDLELSLFGLHVWKDGYIVQLIYFTLFFAAQTRFKIEWKLINWMVIVGTAISIYGLFQSIGIDFMQVTNFKTLPVIAGMYNQNFLGSYLVLLLPITVFLFLKEGSISYLFALFAQFYCLLGTLTRGAWLGFICSFLVLIILFIKRKFIIINTGKKFIMLMSCIIITIFLFEVVNNGILIGRFFSIFQDTSNLVMGEDIAYVGSYRGFIWSKTIDYIIQKPLYGYGIQNIMIYFFADHMTEMKETLGQVILVNNVHNEYLQIAVSTGIPSLIVISIATVAVLKKAIMNLKSNVIYIPIVASLIGYLVQYFFSLSFITNTFIIYIFLGAILERDIEYNINIDNVY